MTTTTEQPVDGETELAVDALPFLQITSTYPRQAGGVETISLEMNLGPDDQQAEISNAEGTAIRAWLIDLCTFTIDAMRRPPRPQAIVLTGTGAKDFLTDRLVHADDCDGTCGQDGPETAAQRRARHQQFVDRVHGRTPGQDQAATEPAEHDGGA
jgi:hypothetical protein